MCEDTLEDSPKPDPDAPADGSTSQKVIALDVGTTTLRCHVYNNKMEVVGEAVEKIALLYPYPGWVEMDPQALWEQVVHVVKQALKVGGISPSDVSCMGISTQRSSFVTWDKETRKPFHNFITWKDLRANHIVNTWNSSITMKALRFGSRLLHLLTRRKRFLAGSVIKLMNVQAITRLMWALENVPELKVAADNGTALMGTVDTWLVYHLTDGRIHATDYSNASATSIFDPFILKWNSLAQSVFGVPMNILPEIRDSVGDFGVCQEEIFGAAIPITAVVADQGASLFGSCCFEVGDVKVSLGTGSFIDVNCGKCPHASVAGLYPVIGWKIGDDVCHMTEGPASDTGSSIEWARSIGLFDSLSDTCSMARSVSSSNGVHFVPSFSGLQAPYNDGSACAAFIGLNPSSSKQHMVRSVLEAIVYRVVQLQQVVAKETNFRFSSIRVDGGVSNNDFVLQLLADLSGLEVERPHSTDMSVIGAAFMAGLSGGVWRSRKELIRLTKEGKVFIPCSKEDRVLRMKDFHQWESAVHRCLGWHSQDDHNQ